MQPSESIWKKNSTENLRSSMRWIWFGIQTNRELYELLTVNAVTLIVFEGKILRKIFASVHIVMISVAVFLCAFPAKQGSFSYQSLSVVWNPKVDIYICYWFYVFKRLIYLWKNYFLCLDSLYRVINSLFSVLRNVPQRYNRSYFSFIFL